MELSGCETVEDMAPQSKGVNTNPLMAVAYPYPNPQTPSFDQSLERILYIWSVRHPASGYVQGLNDLATPFLTVFLAPYIGIHPL